MASSSVVVGAVLALTAGAASAQSASLEMTAYPDRVILGEPITFTTKTNPLPSDLEWSVRDILPESVELVLAASSEGPCVLLESSNVVRCDLGAIPSGSRRPPRYTIPTILGEIKNCAAHRGESQAPASLRW